VPDDDIVSRVHERARQERLAASQSFEAEQEVKRRHELDFVRLIRAATPALLERFEDVLQPYTFTVRKSSFLHRNRYASVPAAVWILARHHYTAGMGDRPMTDIFGLTHEGVFFDTGKDGLSKELSDEETVKRFHSPYFEAIQRVRKMCDEIGVTLPDF
jgi:hypothetical protein